MPAGRRTCIMGLSAATRVASFWKSTITTLMNTLLLTVRSDNRSLPMQFAVRRVINAGYVGRDQATVRAHIEELQREGVPPPPAVPMLFPLPADTVTTADRIEVTSGQTSGEVEYV